MLAQSGGDEPQDKVGDSGEVREALLYWILPFFFFFFLRSSSPLFLFYFFIWFSADW